MINIAYGPSPRSIIVGYLDATVLQNDKTIDDYIKEKKDDVDYFTGNKDDSKWPPIASFSYLELCLLQASKTDGAILISKNKDSLFQMRSRLKINVKAEKPSASTGTGDATAAAIANKWQIVTMKVSHDGGLKVRYQSPEPQKAGKIISLRNYSKI